MCVLCVKINIRFDELRNVLAAQAIPLIRSFFTIFCSINLILFLWSNSFRACVHKMYYTVGFHKFIELPLTTPPFSAVNDRKLEAIFITHSTLPNKSQRITFIRIYEAISTWAVLFSVQHVFCSWFNYEMVRNGAKWCAVFDILILNGKSIHQSISTKVWHILLRFHLIQFPLACAVFHSQVNKFTQFTRYSP